MTVVDEEQGCMDYEGGYAHYSGDDPSLHETAPQTPPSVMNNSEFYSAIHEIRNSATKESKLSTDRDGI